MNKQEVIKCINDKKIPGCTITYEDERYNEGLITDLSYIEQIDEPEKPVVPQFVADWYEDNKDDFEFNIYCLCVDFHDRPVKLDNRIRRWFSNTSNKSIQMLVAMHFFGYEVKKEKLYTAQLKSTGEYLHYDTETDKVHHFCAYRNTARHSKNYHFTEDELVKYSAWGNDNCDINEVRVKNGN